MIRTSSILCLALTACAAQPVTSPSAPAPRSAITTPTSAQTSPRDLPLVVVVRADWCPTCRRIEPTVTALEHEYAGRVSFLLLDMTDDDTTNEASAAAERAGVGAFFHDNKSTGIVAVFSRDRHELAKLAGESDVARYREPLDRAISASQ